MQDVLEPDVLAIGSMNMDGGDCNGLSDGTATANGIKVELGLTVFLGLVEVQPIQLLDYQLVIIR